MKGKELVPTSQIKTVVAQVHNIGVLHDAMTERSTEEALSDRVSARQVVAKLLPIVEKTLGESRLAFRSDCDCLLSIQQASSMSVILNELITNAIKHGGHHVCVELRQKDDSIVLEVSDDGMGLPSDFDPSLVSNTGLKVVQELASTDFGCRPSFERRTVGTRVRVKLQRLKHEEAYGRARCVANLN